MGMAGYKPLLLSIGLSVGASAEVIYQDFFDDDTLAVNTNGVGGGAANRTMQAHAWADDGDATMLYSGTTYTRRALFYSKNAFLSETGFTLTVYYTTGSVGDLAAHNLSFGLISADTDLATYSGYNPFRTETNVYSLGVNITDDGDAATQGLNFTDGSSRTTLDQSGDNVQFVEGASTPVVIEVEENGTWSYSINGITEASGVIPGGFDLTKQYHVAVYGQDDHGGGKSIQSITLEGGYVAEDFYVSATGSDTNSGTFAEPFATIQYAVDSMSPGDTCYIRGGSYHESVDLSGVSGVDGFPITLAAYDHEKVVLDGRVKLETAWTLEERDAVSLPEGNDTPTNTIPGIGNVYVTTLDGSIGGITQLFVDDKSMTLARWPNALAFSDEVFVRGGSQTLKSSAVHGAATDLADPHSLVDLGVSIQGCVGVFGSVRLVTAHHAGEADFSHNNPATLESGRNYYFLEGGVDNAERVLLDAEQEWAYDESTGKLTFWPENGENPNGLNIYARNMMDAFTGDAGTKHVIIDGLDFFASKFDFNHSDHITIQNCDLTYYSISERALGVENNSKMADFTGGASDFCKNITVYNCAFRYADGTGFNANYVDGLTFENNLIYKTAYYACNEWDKYGQRRNTHAFHSYNVRNTLYRRNTVDTTGSNQSIAFSRYGTSSPEYPIVAEYNFTTRCCGLGTDVSAMYIPEEDVHESVARFNWFIDNNRRDFRWDGANIDEVKTARGNFYRNVGKQGTNPNKHGYKLKGDYHEIYNSITIGDSWTFDIAEGKGGNTNTVSRNNAADIWSTILWEDGVDWDIPGDDENNYFTGYDGYVRSMEELLQDTENWDFRPRADAVELIDRGVSVTCTVDGVEIDVTAGYLGAAPDIGAYEYGDAAYWIPGRQEAGASMPVPVNGAKAVALDADLMYLIGLDGIRAEIYFGTAPDVLSLIASQDDPFNIVTPTLEGSKTYYWRVDTVLGDGTVVAGEIWSFNTVLVNDIPPHTVNSISGGASWTEDGASGALIYNNSGTTFRNRALAYSSETFQSDDGLKLTVWYTTGSIDDSAAHQLSFGLIADDIDMANYTGYNPFGATEGTSTSVYSLGVSVVNAEEHGQESLRGLNFTDGSSRSSLDESGDHVQFMTGVPTPVVIEVLQGGNWSYSIDGIIEAEGIIPGGFDLSRSYRAAVYGQDDNGGGKSIQYMSLELLDAPENYETWIAGYGLTGNAALLTADPENGGLGDGYNNLAEFALGMNPTHDDAGSRDWINFAMDGGTNWFEYVYNRRSDYSMQDLDYLLIDSTNLLGSTSMTNGQDKVWVGPVVDGYEVVTNRYQVDDAVKFINLEIHQH